MPVATDKLGAMLNAVSATAAEADRTAIINVENRAYLALTLVLSQPAAIKSATSLRARIWMSTNGASGPWGRVQSLNVSGGIGTSRDFTILNPTSDDESMDIPVECQARTHVKVIVEAPDAVATATLTLYGATQVEV